MGFRERIKEFHKSVLEFTQRNGFMLLEHKITYDYVCKFYPGIPADIARKLSVSIDELSKTNYCEGFILTIEDDDAKKCFEMIYNSIIGDLNSAGAPAESTPSTVVTAALMLEVYYKTNTLTIEQTNERQI